MQLSFLPTFMHENHIDCGENFLSQTHPSLKHECSYW